jgi:tetratricopeptide (TPR) repeat protein
MAKRNQKKAEETLVDIVEARDSARDFFEENKNLVTGVLVALIVVVGGIFVYRHFIKEPREKEASQQLAQAQYQFERDSFALALTNPGNGFMGFADLAEEYANTRAGNLALYYAGISYLNLGQFEAALDYLNDFSPAGDITPAMRLGAIGDAHAELNDLDKALSQYEKAANRTDNDLIKAYYLKKAGMLQEKMGNTAEAREVYQTIKDNYGNTPYAADIDKYLARVAQ